MKDPCLYMWPCMEKSSILRTISQEYTTMSSANKNQKSTRKHQDSEVQIIYMINQVLKSKTSKSKIFDRTPICELFLSLIFEKIPGLGKAKLNAKLQWNLFIKTYERYPTLYKAENFNSFGKKIINNL